MKKLLSVVLAVAVLATMAFSMMVSTASAEDVTYSLLPKTADKFAKVEGTDAVGKGMLTITALDNGGFSIKSDQGWPTAYYFEEGVTDYKASESWVSTKSGSGSTLNYDFEVKGSGAKVLVYFCGQNPNDMANLGSFVSINALEMPDKMDKLTGDTVEDLPAGTYKASVDIDKIGYAEGLMGPNGEMTIGGLKIFAVGGEVIVNDISITEKSGADNSHHKNVKGEAPQNPVKDPTTNAQSDATTTAAKTTAKAGTDSAKTGDTSNAILFIAVAAVAAGAVVVTAKKQKAR